MHLGCPFAGKTQPLSAVANAGFQLARGQSEGLPRQESRSRHSTAGYNSGEPEIGTRQAPWDGGAQAQELLLGT